MARKILIPIKDIDKNRISIQYGLYLAEKCSMQLEFLHVQKDPKAITPWNIFEEIQAEALADGIYTEVRFSKGKPAKEIIRAEQNADLVIIHGKTDFNAIGSGLIRLEDIPEEGFNQPSKTTKHVMERSIVPTLIISGRFYEMRNPLFTYNGSSQSKGALVNSLTLLSNELFTKGHLLIVTSKPKKAEQLVEEAQTLASRWDVKLDPIIHDGQPGEIIMDEVRKTKCDLIVMGAHGKSWFRGRQFGLHTEYVVAHTQRPLFISC